MNTKICFRCSIEQPITEFYPHSQMKDGHLNKCKTCTKNDAIKRHWIKNQDPAWVESERLRGREKYAKYKYRSCHKTDPDKKKIRSLTSHITAGDGYELHHWSYDVKNAYDTFKITISDHRRLHNKLTYNSKAKCYAVKLTKELLDTRDKHEIFLRSIDVKIS